jgi:putative endonuclease
MGARSYYVYILASKIGGTLYIGVTNDIVRRVGEHKLKVVEGFTEKYNVVRLVYFEQFDDPENAIKREKRLKKWPRGWRFHWSKRTIRTGMIFTQELPRAADRSLEYWIARSSRAMTASATN